MLRMTVDRVSRLTLRMPSLVGRCLADRLVSAGGDVVNASIISELPTLPCYCLIVMVVMLNVAAAVVASVASNPMPECGGVGRFPHFS